MSATHPAATARLAAALAEREARIAAETRPLRHALRQTERYTDLRGETYPLVAMSGAEALLVLALLERHAETLHRGELAEQLLTAAGAGDGERAQAIVAGRQVASTSAAAVAAPDAASPRAQTAREPMRDREAKENDEMTEQSTNGPVDEAVFEAGVLERGAELSAQMVRPQPAAEVTPERTAAELRARLELISEVKRTAMTKDVDYGVVPGTDKATLFKPGAEKLAIVFKLDVQPRNEPIWGPGEHLTVISRATVFHAPTGVRLGYGEGICSSRESKYAYRNAGVKCPECGKETVRKSRPRPDGSGGKGWYCWVKPEKGSDGCGAQFPDDDDPRLVGQKVGRIENPDLPDTWNAVDKMSKKRGYVDAVLSVTGASAIFTQDIGADPSEAEASGLEHGPVVSGELHRETREAAIRLCGGDLDQAKKLWEKLQGEFDGYMPEAAAKALLAAAEKAAVPTGGAQGAGTAGERAQRQRVIARAGDAGQGGDGATPGRRRAAGQSAGRADESNPPTPRRPRARRPRPTRTGRGCGRPRPSAESATRSWRT